MDSIYNFYEEQERVFRTFEKAGVGFNMTCIMNKNVAKKRNLDKVKTDLHDIVGDKYNELYDMMVKLHHGY